MMKRPALLFTLLTVLFCLPGIAAYWFFLHPEFLRANHTNKGTLLMPPYLLSSKASGKKWHLYYWHPGECDEQCLTHLDRLARVRLALGRKLYEVDLHWLRANESPAIDAKLRSELREQDIQITTLTAKDRHYLFKAPAVNYIADPDNYLILSYAKPDNFTDIYQDLKHLLTIPLQKEARHA